MASQLAWWRRKLRHRRCAVVALACAFALQCCGLSTLCALVELPSSGALRREVLVSAAVLHHRTPQATLPLAALVASSNPAVAESEPFDPTNIQKEVGTKIVTPNGLEYEVLQLGSSGTSARDGFPKRQAKVTVRFTGHIDSFDGKVFDSSLIRARRVTGKRDYVEITLYSQQTITTGLCEALRLMKVGEKGRFVQPPQLSYAQGAEFEGDDDSEVKKVPANATLYYEVELVNIVRP
mmetsp:Transcript_59463/g.110042  ORF Transcript_59463/g.110042 Transcript_59463/m.110042 type:complete len:237 (+) Transcript_59463:36-746(+)